MPRGKRVTVSVEDRIQTTCAEIESLQERIRSKKEELKSLMVSIHRPCIYASQIGSVYWLRTSQCHRRYEYNIRHVRIIAQCISGTVFS